MHVCGCDLILSHAGLQLLSSPMIRGGCSALFLAVVISLTGNRQFTGSSFLLVYLDTAMQAISALQCMQGHHGTASDLVLLCCVQVSL